MVEVFAGMVQMELYLVLLSLVIPLRLMMVVVFFGMVQMVL